MAPEGLKPIISNLVELKRGTDEIGMGPAVPEINAFIEHEFDRHGTAFSGQGRPDVIEKREAYDRLNQVFRSAVITRAD